MQRTYSRFIVKPYLQWYLSKKRIHVHENLKLQIYPGVFHPGHFFSTRVLVNFIKDLPLKEKRFCEPGAGSGILSLIAYQQGATVTCFDINENAVKGIEENFRNNFANDKLDSFQVFHSDLFDKVPSQTFDVIVINPPYFFETPASAEQKAWYCGKNGEYFEKLFSQLTSYSDDKTQIYMILADNCDINRIEQIADKNRIVFHLVHQEKVKWENNCIFKLILK